MKISPEDVQIFVLTYNREVFLEQTLQSILRQTVKGFSVIVLDNGSTDNTPQTVEKYKKNGIVLNRIEKNLGVYNNYIRAQQLANRKWVMVFHDDDLIHPSYIEEALKIINKFSKIVLVCSAMKYDNNSNFNWDKIIPRFKYNKKSADFATLFYNGWPIHFASTIYKTSLFKNTKIENNIYGRIADIPFMLDIAKNGPVVTFLSPFVKYRCHPGQDTNNISGDSSVNELIALQKKYFSFMGDSIFTQSGRIFLFRNYQRLKLNYSWKKKSEKIVWKDFVKLSIKNQSTSKNALIIGSIAYYFICLLKFLLSKLK